jgi:hypothetical protein
MSVNISNTVSLLPNAFSDRLVVSEIASPDVKTDRAASATPTMLERCILVGETKEELTDNNHSTGIKRTNAIYSSTKAHDFNQLRRNIAHLYCSPFII